LRTLKSSVLLIVSCIVQAGSPAFAASPGESLRQYLQARWRGDVQAAQALWDADDLRRSQALGTSYSGLEARFDDNLLWSAEERAAVAASQPVLRDSSVEADWARFTVVLQPAPAAGPDTLLYGVRRTEDGWFVTTPYRKLTAPWTARDGRFFKLRASKLRDVNVHGLSSLDAALVEMMDRLQVPDLTRLRLERVKLEYYLCHDDAEVAALTGRRDPSQYRLAGERIVTRSLADRNALARAVLHLALRDGPAFTAPVLEDGLAAAIGSWDGAAGSVVIQQAMGRLARKAVDPEAALGGETRRALAPQVATPASALWSAALLQQPGPAAFLQLCRDLGGSRSQTAGRSAADVRAAIETVVGRKGADLSAWMQQTLQGIEPPLRGGCSVLVHETFERRSILSWRDRAERWTFQMFEMEGDYMGVMSPYEGPVPAWMKKMVDSVATARGTKVELPGSEPRGRPPGDPPQLVILLRDRLYQPEAFESPLFLEHFPTRKYGGERYGLFVSPDEIRLIDYRTGLLVGCGGRDCAAPGGPPLYDEAPGRVCFRMARDLLGAPLLEFMAMTVEYTGE
jgi:hypothetical protein